MDKIRAEFEQWWDSANDITNSGPWAHDTPIQFAWDAWQAALSQAEQIISRSEIIDVLLATRGLSEGVTADAILAAMRSGK